MDQLEAVHLNVQYVLPQPEQIRTKKKGTSKDFSIVFLRSFPRHNEIDDCRVHVQAARPF